MSDNDDSAERVVQCNYCQKWWQSRVLPTHVLLAHPESEEAEIILLMKESLRVARNW